MFKKGQMITGLIFNVVILLVIAKLATGSLNPFEVFRGESLFLKILVGFFMFAIVASLLGLAYQAMLSDVRCGKCGHPLMEFASAYGQPFRCRFCGKWFHKLCVQEDGGSMLEGCKQPDCPSGRTMY